MATRFAHISGGILSHSSLQILSKSSRFWGWCLPTRTFSSLHRFSLGWRSGDWLGNSKTLMCFFLSHSFVALAVCFGSLSCWNNHPQPVFNALAGFNGLILTVHGPVHRPFDAVQLSCPLSRKAPPKHNVCTSMFDGGMVFLGSQAAFFLLQTQRDELHQLLASKELDFGLTWTQHFHPVQKTFKCSLANFRRACTCAFLSRGTLRNPTRLERIELLEIPEVAVGGQCT